jgi:hypothetical protein
METLSNSQQELLVTESPAKDNLQQQLTPLVIRAKTVIVSSDEELVVAKEIAQTVKAFQKEINDTFDPIINKTRQAHKEALAQKKRHMDPLVEAEDRIKLLIGNYLTFVENEKKKEAERLAELARQEREAELRKIQSEIDGKLSQYSSVEEKIVALQTAMADADQDRFALIDAKLSALYAEQENLTSKAAEVQELVNVLNLVPPQYVNIAAPKVKGLSSRVNRIPQVVNAMALIKAVASGEVPPTVIEFNMSNIKKLVNAGMKLPGVSVTEQRNVSVRNAS